MSSLEVLSSRKQKLQSLKSAVHRFSGPAAVELVEQHANGDVRCFACGHQCLVKPGRDGVCRVRFNVEGQLRVPRGYVAALACDPVEKKPFYHFLPGSDALTFGMLGCDFHCGYCQNWVTSQMLRDENAVAEPDFCSADQLVDLAIRERAPILASSYNEPLITSEWAVEVFKLARARGLKCAFVSNGNATERVLDYLRPHVDAYKVDLKSFNDASYRQLGGVLEHVTSTIRNLKRRGYWVEIVTLVVPGFSSDRDEMKRAADFLAEVDPLMPWHMTAFHPDYKMTDGYRRTTADELVEIANVAQKAGLKYIYPGNLPGLVGEWENTRCHHCNSTIIRRAGFAVLENRVTASGDCPDCGGAIPGIWGVPSGRHDGQVRRVRL
jgi:pyruvate formate lyase activating enzyme